MKQEIMEILHTTDMSEGLEEGTADQILDLLSTQEEKFSKYEVLAEAMKDAPVGHRVTIKYLNGSDEWTLTRREPYKL